MIPAVGCVLSRKQSGYCFLFLGMPFSGRQGSHFRKGIFFFVFFKSCFCRFGSARSLIGNFRVFHRERFRRRFRFRRHRRYIKGQRTFHRFRFLIRHVGQGIGGGYGQRLHFLTGQTAGVHPGCRFDFMGGGEVKAGGFRFVQLQIQAAEEDCVISGFDYLETGYPLDVKTKAEASDPSFDGIWDISLRTLKRCMHETYEDCPFYEQLQYAMDSRSEILYTYMTSGDDRLARQCMDDFRRSQRADGMINCCYPHWGPNIIPGFAVYYIMMVYDHMMFFGDKKLIKTHLGAIDGVLEYFDNHLENRGIVGKTGGHISERYWSFIDWSVPWGPTVGTPPSGLKGPITMESFLYIFGLQHAAKLCDYVGRNDTAAEYRSRAQQVQNAINTYCRDEAGFYLDSPGVKDYSQHCQVFAVLTDTVSLEEGRRLVLATLDDPEKFAQCTVAAMFYVFRAPEKIGAYDRTETLWETWRNMLKNNLSTCVENYVGERSDCHAWGSLLLHELPAVILGVRPAAPGFEKVAIAPVPGYLSWAKGDVVTPWGMVHVEWEKQSDGTVKLHYEVPEEMKKRVEVHV